MSKDVKLKNATGQQLWDEMKMRMDNKLKRDGIDDDEVEILAYAGRSGMPYRIDPSDLDLEVK